MRGSSHSILVAEDDRVMSDVIRFNLEQAGLHVTVARNGVDAWEKLQVENFDALVTDFQMPGLTGQELCQKYRAMHPDGRLPIILLTARGLELDSEMMKKELGITTLLFKPFSPRDLKEIVMRSLTQLDVCIQ